MFPLPPRPRRGDGAWRRVGVELELAGLRPWTIAEVTREALGGSVEPHTAVHLRVLGTVLGDLDIELDFALLQRMANERTAGSGAPEWLLEVGEWTTELMERVASQVVPWEIVTGPIPLPELHRLDELIGALREAGALGTRHAPHYAFGVHLNPELPAYDAETVAGLVKAFLCLKDWLRQRERPDLTRLVTPYIADFDDEWVARTVDPEYRPSLSELIDDYLVANPTRNRSLDLLPLFAWLDEPRVRRAVADPLVKARPTLHYRLPNCEIDRPGWGLGDIWEDWVEVERLAADRDRLAAMGRAYRQWLQRFRVPFDTAWVRETERWLRG